MTESSAVGNIVDLEKGQLLLPAFVSRRADGIYVDLLAIDSRSLVAQFVDRVFAAGARFAGLDYELFLNLLFLWEPGDIDRQLEECKRKGRSPQVCLAQDVVPFPEARRGIYRGVKVLDDGMSAEYIFEQISVERELDDPMAPDGSGRRKVVDRLRLDFDEFVAALWEKGVRFGIDARAVKEAIARDRAERLTIAQMKPPTEGRDASIDEQTDLLHRDDAPRLLPNGRVDLHHYRNRFPQVTAGTRLFRKVQRVPGIPGWDVQGNELAPAAVNDFDIQTLAGAGTQVMRDAQGEYIAAAADGFLDVDAQSGQLSVIDKIISREGVSMRTTGDLSLAGDEYEEHGEVQEKRVVEGRNMTFLADVYGKIVSGGGRITLKRNISGGTAQSPGGSIVVEGAASRATLEARRGGVDVARAEGCLIIADRVRIERAVNCDIVADEVEIQQSEGCAIAAKKVVLQNSAARKDEATIVTLLLPDLSRYQSVRMSLETSRAEAEAEIAAHGAAIQELTAQPEMKSYLAILPKVKAKTLTMSAAQQAQWQTLLTRLAPTLRQVAALNAKIQQARANIAEIGNELETLKQNWQGASQGISCEIESVAGDTLVRAQRQAEDAKPLGNLPAKDLHVRLRAAGDVGTTLFSGSAGSFAWQPPAEEAAQQDSGQD